MMRVAMREVPCDYVFLPRARADYETMPAADREVIDALVGQICMRPDVDGVLTHDLPMPPVMRRLYDNGAWSIAFDVIEPAVVRVFQISRGGRAV